ncbi:organic cation transporter protein [Trichonephila clavata]|uniref:Organic cation transporter protein n=1 Tax=Trichonephila clavata TaxID=2740835 RepID=A0A8X6KD56_TRICU|nr:organic cation transporter protein [Trichonephila clavata]
MEIMSPKYRSDYGIGTYFGWSIGYLIVPLFAWLLRDWLWIHIVITLPCFFLLSSWWLLPESPRWLLSQGRHEEALEVLSKAAKANGVDINEADAKLKEVILKLEKEQTQETETSTGNVLQLLKPGMWQKTLIVLYLWSIIAFVYYGISYNTNELAGDPFLNFAAYGIIEVPAYILLLFVMRSKGRRNPLAISLVASGIACLLIYPIPEDPWWASTAVSLFGKFCIACSFSIVYVCTAEIFPTTVRNVGLGTASVSARIGSIIAPFVRELGKATHPVIPQIIFGVLAATGGILALLLPEMTNRSVPDTLKEAAELSRKTRSKTKTDTRLTMKELNKFKEKV